MKVCNKCGFEYPLEMFCKHPSTKDKRSNFCRTCRSKRNLEYVKRTNAVSNKQYQKTPKGFVMRLYRNMKSRIEGVQKQKYHLYAGKELLSKELFYDWALNHPDFHSLFSAYTASSFNRQLAPSVDRINPERGYTIDNMRWMTHKENSSLGQINRSQKSQIRVSQFDLSGNHVKTYRSITAAASHIGADISGISMAIHGKIKTCSGFIWKRV